MTTKEIQELCKELTSLLERTYSDLANTLVGYDGNLTGIECGTLIEIRTDAGYVSLSRYANAIKLRVVTSEQIQLGPVDQKNDVRGESLK